jgi:TonB family protein
MTPVRRSFFAAVVIGAICTTIQGRLARAGQSAGSPVKVYKVGKDVTNPQLLSQDLSAAVVSHCDRMTSGPVKVSAVIDAEGVPHNLMFVQATGSDLDRLAMQIVHLDRFSPAMREGTPVAIAETISMPLGGCVQNETDASGRYTQHLRLASVPDQTLEPFDGYPEKVIFASEAPMRGTNGKAPSYKVGPDVSAPRLLRGTTSIDIGKTAPDKPSKPKYQGEDIISVIIDAQGLPEDVHVVRPLGMGLDEKAVDTLKRARFIPALRNGREPVPVSVELAVSFRLY